MTGLRCRCYVCNVDIHNRHYVGHFWSRRHLKNIADCSREDDDNKLYKVLSMRQLTREWNNYFH